MTTNLSLTDQWNATPVGPIVGDAHTPAAYCADLGQLTQNETFLFNRLIKTLLGSFKTYVAAAVNVATNEITLTAHGIAANTVVRYGNVGGTDMAATGMLAPDVTVDSLSTTPLYVNVVDANTITLALTSGGAAIDITNAGSGTHYLWIVPAAADALMHTAFTTGAGNTIPAGSLRVTLAAYYAALNGCTFTGAVTHTGAVICSSTVRHSDAVTYLGNDAYTIERCGGLNDAATQTIIGTNYHHWLCPDPSQDSVYTITDGTEEGQWFVVSRRKSVNAFKADFNDSGAVLIARFPASAKSWCKFRWSNQDGAGLKWHADEYGGSTIAGT